MFCYSKDRHVTERNPTKDKKYMALQTNLLTNELWLISKYICQLLRDVSGYNK